MKHYGKKILNAELILALFLATVFCGIFLYDAYLFAAKINSNYKKKIAFSKSEAIKFPDFTLEYAGSRKEIRKKDSSSTIYYDFVVSDKHGLYKMSWTPSDNKNYYRFVANNNFYYLELKYSKFFGRLGDNELVVLTNQQFSN